MKKIISACMAFVMVATMVFAFSAPATASSISFNGIDPYYETYFVTNDTYRYAEMSFTIRRTGYYIIQTFGFFDGQGAPVETEAIMELYSSDDFISDDIVHSGYNQGCFINAYLEENEEYRLIFGFSQDVDFGRLSITNAAASFYFDPPINEYYQILPLYINEAEGSFSFQLEFPNQFEQRAVVYLLEYWPIGNDAPSTMDFRITADGCACTHVALVVPYGHGFVSFGGEQVVFDACQTSIEVSLEKRVPYYLVVYLGVGDLVCPDHSQLPIVELIIESV